jgi:hypothetical protein
MGTRPLSERSIRFRARLITALRANYLSRDLFVGTCPWCDGYIHIHFHGIAPRATVRCQFDCTQAEIIRGIYHR